MIQKITIHNFSIFTVDSPQFLDLYPDDFMFGKTLVEGYGPPYQIEVWNDDDQNEKSNPKQEIKNKKRSVNKKK